MYDLFDFIISNHRAELDYYRFIVIANELSADPAADILLDFADVYVIQGGGGPFHKLAQIGQSDNIETPLVHFVTSDDGWYFDFADSRRMAELGALVSVGHFLCARPIGSGCFRIYRGRTVHKEYMDLAVTEDRMWRFVGQGPETVYATYDREYFRSIAILLSQLIKLLDDAGRLNLIEDVLSVVNLSVRTMFAKSSTCLRYVDVNYSGRANHKFSWVALGEIINSRDFVNLVRFVAAHLSRASAIRPDEVLSLTDINIAQAVVNFSNGYRTMALRKWREWMDVEFFPFSDHGTGVAPNAGSPNKYDVVYRWSKGALVDEVFPSQAWIADPLQRSLVDKIPMSVWRSKAV
jgi:hypothetical protein